LSTDDLPGPERQIQSLRNTNIVYSLLEESGE
jgi:hypothetical protein